MSTSTASARSGRVTPSTVQPCAVRAICTVRSLVAMDRVRNPQSAVVSSWYSHPCCSLAMMLCTSTAPGTSATRQTSVLGDSMPRHWTSFICLPVHRC